MNTPQCLHRRLRQDLVVAKSASDNRLRSVCAVVEYHNLGPYLSSTQLRALTALPTRSLKELRTDAPAPTSYDNSLEFQSR